MRTTVNLDDDLLRGAKTLAAQTGRTLTSILEDALREVLYRRAKTPHRKPVHLAVSTCKPGYGPGVDLDNSAALLDILEGRDGPDVPS